MVLLCHLCSPPYCTTSKTNKRIKKIMSYSSLANCLRVFSTEQEKFALLQIFDSMCDVCKRKQAIFNSHNVHYRPPHDTSFAESQSPSSLLKQQQQEKKLKKKNIAPQYNLTFSFIKFSTEEQYSVRKSGSLYIEN